MDETECYGVPVIGINDKIPLSLARDKMSQIKAVNAQAIVTVCPFCHMMFDNKTVSNRENVQRNVWNTSYAPPTATGLGYGLLPRMNSL